MRRQHCRQCDRQSERLYFRRRKGAGIRRRDRQGRNAVRRGHARGAEDICEGAVREERLHVDFANEIEGFSVRGHRCGEEIVPEHWPVRLCEYRRLLPFAAQRSAAELYRHRAREKRRRDGFENEKDHPEVAPSQFEINYSYGEVVAAADQIQLL